MIRLLLPVPSPAPERLTVQGERFHYLRHVLRLSAGDTLELFDGRGTCFDGRVESLTEHSAELSLGPARAGLAGGELTLIQGLPKADKLEWILQKCTELGVTRFIPAATERAVVKLDAERGDTKRGRWQKIAEEAARQCGRADVPEVLAPRPLLAAATGLAPGTRLLILDEEERALPLSAAVHEAGSSPLALVIGPEGGLARAEVDALVKLGARTVTLGARVLRTETAAIAAAALVQHLRGDLG